MKSACEKDKVCLVSCSVLKEELLHLVKEGKLDAELVFVSKNFHVDYGLLENNLRKVVEHTKKRSNIKIVVVYGDLCLGQDGEMKKLMEEYGLTKVDAVNCVDCQLGGGDKFSAADPNHNLMFMGPGMIDFFKDVKHKMLQEGMDEATFANMFSGVKGFVVLDTCGNGEMNKTELEKIGMGVPVLEVRKIGTSGVLSVVLDAIKRV
jgi:hypothetical protein